MSGADVALGDTAEQAEEKSTSNKLGEQAEEKVDEVDE
jgi:hypothetical protein